MSAEYEENLYIFDDDSDDFENPIAVLSVKTDVLKTSDLKKQLKQMFKNLNVNVDVIPF